MYNEENNKPNKPENESAALGWRAYSKIETAEARKTDGTREIWEGVYRNSTIAYLQEEEFVFHEKIDGTNMSAFWDGHRVWINDRTGLNKLPPAVNECMERIFCTNEAEEIFEQLFGETQATIYGECYGDKIQAVGKLYVQGTENEGKTDFIVFDVKVGSRYLLPWSPKFEEIISAFGLKAVPKVMTGKIREAIDFVKTKPQSKLNPAAPMEGLVGRPMVNLYGDEGRVIVKIKVRDYVRDTFEKWNWIKPGKRVYYKDEYGRQKEAMVRLVESPNRRVQDENTIVECTETWNGSSTEKVLVPADRIVKAESKKWKGERDKSRRPQPEMSPEQEKQ